MPRKLKWREGYSGETVEELLSFESEYDTDSLVRAFELALQEKRAAQGSQSLSEVEVEILAVRAFDREVNNGGYDQFFRNSSKEFAPVILTALSNVVAVKSEKLTRDVFEVLGLNADSTTPDDINTAMSNMPPESDEKLDACDQAFYTSGEYLSELLLVFIKKNRAVISF